MSVKIIIIGLGQIGGSIGLALAEHRNEVDRIGYDTNVEVARKAEKAGAIDKMVLNLIAAVREADLIILAIPMDQIRETLEYIAPEMKEGAVIMDTGPVKGSVIAWMGELLPPNRYYVGLTPVLNPTYLHSYESGFESARADLFHNGLLGITAPSGASSQAIKLAGDLSQLLGADPLFTDPLEMDGLMAATYLLPQLIGAALISSTVNQPGWREGRKITGRAYTRATDSFIQMDAPIALSAAAILNRDNIVRVLDNVIAMMETMRDEIENQESEALNELLLQARQFGDKWWAERKAANWRAEELSTGVETPRSRDMLGRLIGLGRKPKSRKDAEQG